MAPMRLCVLAGLGLASASRIRVEQQGEVVVSEKGTPMHLYRQDCGAKRPLHRAHSSRHLGLLGKEVVASKDDSEDPGAGMDQKNLEPFTTVLKDGYYLVDCVKDYMFVHGDKFGNGKFHYELGEVSNVSIVHYSDIIPKEDREEMSHAACFAFCRTVPEMMFFGINNGRDCYCAPYYKAMAGDSSDCDAVCPGDKTTMCGGKGKSSVFAMHMCANAEEELAKAIEELEKVEGVLDELEGNFSVQVKGMSRADRNKVKYLGQRGDRGATAVVRSMQNFRGKLDHAKDDADVILDKMETLKGDADGFAGQDMTDFAVVTDLEKIIKEMKKLTKDGAAMVKKMTEMQKVFMYEGDATGAASQYYKTMYFVDRNATEYPSTCGGDEAGPSFAFENPSGAEFNDAYEYGVDTCAAQCDKKVGECVGFQVIMSTRFSICGLFSKLKTAFYYTGCTVERVRIAAAKANLTQCYAKLQYFEGTNLAPDASGKRKGALRKVTHADRCWTGGLNEF